MNQQQTEDPQTEAEITVEDWHDDFAGQDPFAPSGQRPRREFTNTVGFTYSNDVLNLGDPFSFTIPNPKGRYNKIFQRGSTVTLRLRNPNVNGGHWTLKHEGIVINRTLRCDRSGCYLDIQAADRGWHLRENDAPLWYVLQGGTWTTLLTDGEFIDPSWGIKGVVMDNETTRLIRLGQKTSDGKDGSLSLNQSRAEAQLQLQTLGTTIYIQVEPGDRVADLITMYARRIGRLFTVSPDGYMQLWIPAENKVALYAINFHGFDENNRNRNTVISCQVAEDMGSIYTEVTCLGEVVGGEIARDTPNQNATKRRGTFINEDALPFLHRVNYADGDIFDGTAALNQAHWRYNRGIFDSWSATYIVRGHHCQGNWWEVDNYCTVHDSVNGIDGDFYVAAVVYQRDDRGDLTTVTLRKPGLLKSSFGVLPNAPLYSAAETIPVSGTSSQIKRKTTKAK